MRVRPASAADAPAIAAIYAPHVTDGAVSFEVDAPDAAEMARRMRGADGPYPWLVAEQDDTVVGYTYAAAFAGREAYRWAVETTIYLAAAGQGRGIGRRLYTALLATLEEQGFTQAVGRIALPNPASVALHEALGFACVGSISQSAGRAAAGSMSAYGNARLPHSLRCRGRCGLLPGLTSGKAEILPVHGEVARAKRVTEGVCGQTPPC